MAVLLVGERGNDEVGEFESIYQWHENVREAEFPKVKSIKFYRKSLEKTARTIESSGSHKWTSAEYFFVAVYDFPELGIDQARKHVALKAFVGRMWSEGLPGLNDRQISCDAAYWGEYGESELSHVDVAARIGEFLDMPAYREGGLTGVEADELARDC